MKPILKVVPQIPRRLVNSARGLPRKRVAFIHVQKCGGSSVSQALQEVYLGLTPRTIRTLDVKSSFTAAAASEQPVADLRSGLLLYFLAQPSTRLITGHFPFVRSAVRGPGREFAFVTLLRHPVRRFISAFLYSASKPADAHGRTEPDIRAFLATKRAQALGRTMINYFGERRAAESWEAALPRAVENLKLFRAVGTLEHLAAFRDKLESLVGRRLRVRRRNPTVAPDWLAASVRDEQVIGRITEICEPDLALYSQMAEIHGWSVRPAESRASGT